MSRTLSLRALLPALAGLGWPLAVLAQATAPAGAPTHPPPVTWVSIVVIVAIVGAVLFAFTRSVRAHREQAGAGEHGRRGP